jgi:cephalosporin hydroxylase/glycosyltransferase involved in cell wall biosynthesis
MTAFWAVIQELLDLTQPTHLVEIGGSQGTFTQQLCAWASPHQAFVHVIETQPKDALRQTLEQYPGGRLHVGRSLDLLPHIQGATCFIIDGDHNYYTVYNELKLITEHHQPDLILVHDVGWPWGHRDLYYDVNAIPDAYRHTYVTGLDKGIVPGYPGVVLHKGFRSGGNFCFAETEGGYKNGVLTAVQDFLTESSAYRLFTVDCVFGLGILLPEASPYYARAVTVLHRFVDNPLITLLEEDRLQSFVTSFDAPQALPSSGPRSDRFNLATSMYLDLMKRALLDVIYSDADAVVMSTISKKAFTVAEARRSGLDWPQGGLTMIGLERLNNLQFCVEDVLQRGIPGDFIETGVWRGGSCIFMRSILKIYAITDRTIWVADSFQGLPKPDPAHYPLDKDLDLSMWRELAVSREEVAHNFERFDLLDDQVQFLEGWFKDTLVAAPIEKLAVLRLDGDLYESTMQALTALYPKVVPGGYIIIDDYGAVEACRQAVHDYRSQHGITEEIHAIDWTGVYWQRALPLADSSVARTISAIRQAYHERYESSLRDWLFYHQQHIVFSQSRWQGIPTWKNPLDLWVYQQLLYDLKPDILIEIGSQYGGSTLYFAHVFDAIGKGQVISIDIDRTRYQSQHARIVAITGDSGSPEVVDQVRTLCREKQVVLIHDGSHRYANVLRDLHLYAEFIPVGSYMIVEDGIVDIYPTEPDRPTTNPVFEPRFQEQGPLWAITDFLKKNADFEVDSSQERYWLTYSPQGFLKRVRRTHPLISLVIVVYNMQRAAPRTLQSFTAAYQGIPAELYEVIVVDNGSSQPLSRDMVEAFGPNFHYVYRQDASPSPASALNFGVQHARGRMVGLMIDGARMVSPGVLKYAVRALKAYTNPVLSTLGWHLGPQLQREAIKHGYSEQVEDQLLQQIGWPEDGYKLFSIAALAGSSAEGWLLPIAESNCIFLLRDLYDAIGGFDEQFDAPGGGIVNLDFYYRVCEYPTAELIILLGEGSFHQIHGGVMTNDPDDKAFQGNLARWLEQYRVIRGQDFKLSTRTPEYWGHMPPESGTFMEHSVQRLIAKLSQSTDSGS